MSEASGSTARVVGHKKGCCTRKDRPSCNVLIAPSDIHGCFGLHLGKPCEPHVDICVGRSCASSRHFVCLRRRHHPHAFAFPISFHQSVSSIQTLEKSTRLASALTSRLPTLNFQEPRVATAPHHQSTSLPQYTGTLMLRARCRMTLHNTICASLCTERGAKVARRPFGDGPIPLHATQNGRIFTSSFVAQAKKLKHLRIRHEAPKHHLPSSLERTPSLLDQDELLVEDRCVRRRRSNRVLALAIEYVSLSLCECVTA